MQPLHSVTAHFHFTPDYLLIVDLMFVSCVKLTLYANNTHVLTRDMAFRFIL